MIVQQEILRKLLYGAYDSREELEAELGDKIEAFYREKQYYVAIVNFEDPLKVNLSVSKREFQDIVEKHFAANLKRVHWLYCISPVSYTHLDVYKRQEMP